MFSKTNGNNCLTQVEKTPAAAGTSYNVLKLDKDHTGAHVLDVSGYGLDGPATWQSQSAGESENSVRLLEPLQSPPPAEFPIIWLKSAPHDFGTTTLSQWDRNFVPNDNNFVPNHNLPLPIQIFEIEGVILDELAAGFDGDAEEDTPQFGEIRPV